MTETEVWVIGTTWFNPESLDAFSDLDTSSFHSILTTLARCCRGPETILSDIHLVLGMAAPNGAAISFSSRLQGVESWPMDADTVISSGQLKQWWPNVKRMAGNPLAIQIKHILKAWPYAP
jgi:hypothetical protein